MTRGKVFLGISLASVFFVTIIMIVLYERKNLPDIASGKKIVVELKIGDLILESKEYYCFPGRVKTYVLDEDGVLWLSMINVCDNPNLKIFE